MTHLVLPDFVVDEDVEEEGQGVEAEVAPVERARAERDGEWRVAHDCAEGRLEEQAEVERAVAHALHRDGHLAGLGDEQVGPLHDDDRDEVGGLRLRQRRHVEALVVERAVAVRDGALLEDGREVGVCGPEGTQVHAVGPFGFFEEGGLCVVGCFVGSLAVGQ